jgi:hypothetical protein
MSPPDDTLLLARMPQLLHAHSCCKRTAAAVADAVQTLSQRAGLLCHQLPPASMPHGSFAAAEGGRVMWRSLEHSRQGASSASCAMRSALQQTTCRQHDGWHSQDYMTAQCSAQDLCLLLAVVHELHVRQQSQDTAVNARRCTTAMLCRAGSTPVIQHCLLWARGALQCSLHKLTAQYLPLNL